MRSSRTNRSVAGAVGTIWAGRRRWAETTGEVFDIPPISVRVSEHQLIKRRCGCGTVTSAQAPEGVSAPVQYGPRITAIILYLYVGGVPVQEAHRRGVGRAVRHPRLPRHRRGDDHPRGR